MDMSVGAPGKLAEVSSAVSFGHANQSRLSPLASNSAIRTQASATSAAVRRWVRQLGNCLRTTTLAKGCGTRIRGIVAWSRAARSSASGGGHFSIGATFSRPLEVVTSGRRLDPAMALIPSSRSFSRGCPQQ